MLDFQLPSSPSLRVKHSPDPLLSYATLNVDTLIKCSKKKTYFQHRLLPDLACFIRHIYFKCHITPTVLVIGLIYLERLKASLPSQSRGEYDTPYKMFLAAVVLASKFADDNNSVTHSVYRFVSPLYSRKELNEMERSFLGVIKFNLYVDLSQVSCFVKEHQDAIELELDLAS
ncbi:cyclin domain-containing protein [Phycomyces nitens]|nr:cyclin domain-containing protein [Phycomyces nitens]